MSNIKNGLPNKLGRPALIDYKTIFINYRLDCDF